MGATSRTEHSKLHQRQLYRGLNIEKSNNAALAAMALAAAAKMITMAILAIVASAASGEAGTTCPNEMNLCMSSELAAIRHSLAQIGRSIRHNGAQMSGAPLGFFLPEGNAQKLLFVRRGH